MLDWKEGSSAMQGAELRIVLPTLLPAWASSAPWGI